MSFGEFEDIYNDPDITGKFDLLESLHEFSSKDETSLVAYINNPGSYLSGFAATRELKISASEDRCS